MNRPSTRARRRLAAGALGLVLIAGVAGATVVGTASAASAQPNCPSLAIKANYYWNLWESTGDSYYYRLSNSYYDAFFLCVG